MSYGFTMNRSIVSWMLPQIFMLKWFSQLAKVIIPHIHPICSIPSSTIELTNWPIKEVYLSKLSWRQIFPCQYIHVYSISIFTYNFCLKCLMFTSLFFAINHSPCLFLMSYGYFTNVFSIFNKNMDLICI